MGFAADVAKFAKLTNSSLTETGRAIAVEWFTSVIKDTPVDTGRAKGNWQASINTPKSGTTTRDGEQGAINEVRGQATQFNPGQVFYMANNLPYILRLEYGYSKQAPAGMVRKNKARLTSIVKKAVQDNKV